MPPSPAPPSTPPPPPARIDPTPRSGDVTSLEQAKAKSPPSRAQEPPDLEGDMEAPDPVRSSMRQNAEPPRPFDFKRGETPTKSNNPPDKPKKKAQEPELKEDKDSEEEEDFSPAKDPSGHKKKKAADDQIEKDLEEYADQEKPGIEPDEDDEEDHEDDDAAKEEKEEGEEQDEEAQEKELDHEVEKIGPLHKVRKAHKEVLKKLRRHEQAMAGNERTIQDLKKQLKEATEGALAVEQREAYEQKINQYEERIRAIDYKGSQEFREKYQKPLEEAWEACLADIDEMVVDGEDGIARKATAEDFSRILAMPDLGSASAEARRLFGTEVSPLVMQHRQNVRKASRALEIADKEAVKNAQEVAKKRAEKDSSDRLRMEKIYSREFDDYGDKYSHLFAERDEDPEGNGLLKKGWEQVQTVIRNDQDVPEDVRIKRLVALRYKAAAFSRLYRDSQALQKQVQELEEQLKRYERSKPKPGRDLGDGSDLNGSRNHDEDDGPDIADYADRNYR